MISRKSRYFRVEVGQWVDDQARITPYLRRRFLPSPRNVTVIARHQVSGGERLDNVTARYLGDPEVFWRVADANDAMRPDELLEEIGRILVIPLPMDT